MFDGRRIWSVVARDYQTDHRGVRHVEWPDSLLDFLDGRARVELRVHGEDTAFAAVDASFGSGEGRVDVVDEAGRPVALTKWGRFNHPFDATDRRDVDSYLDEVEQVLWILSDECGLPSFISFGTLLGAVREGRLIGHDVDVDVGYLSDYEHPADVQRENFRIERVLRDHGYEVFRQNGGFLALFIYYPDGTRRNLDVFTCFVVGNRLYQVHDVGTIGNRSAILPLRQIPCEGRMLPAPARPEKLLEPAYGRDWRIPNPAFEFHTPLATKRRIGGWLGGIRMARDGWFKFYDSHTCQNGMAPTMDPTSFATWVADREDPCELVDVGCGNGRDSLHFAARGFDVLGVDYVRRASRYAEEQAMAEHLPLSFEACNLYSLRETLTVGARLAHRPGPRVVYGRFLLHAIDDSGRENLWRLCEMALRGGGRCYLEFRTTEDIDLPKHFDGRFRRFLDVESIVAEAQHHGARVVSQEVGFGLAPFVDEDPHICRLALEWTG